MTQRAVNIDDTDMSNVNTMRSGSFTEASEMNGRGFKRSGFRPILKKALVTQLSRSTKILSRMTKQQSIRALNSRMACSLTNPFPSKS
eukprot:CAMPEP_0184702628 /NCGR_PEP_ID=MMETSP0313-20130426/24902_1 /TAXON_ID=2792 /ORGANISM="Porphyridium aerugineum, Strain SAG 1380-2" /LENGTH=87 /DNA_ID=CAMNT_0027163161 /DNA_START=394 /DNA_END=653 /DNA_ORIENTATION=-